MCQRGRHTCFGSFSFCKSPFCFVFEQWTVAADLLLWICFKINRNRQLSIVYYVSIPYKFTILMVLDSSKNWLSIFTAKTVTASQTYECFCLCFHIFTWKINWSTMDVCCSFHDLTLTVRFLVFQKGILLIYLT